MGGSLDHRIVTGVSLTENRNMRLVPPVDLKINAILNPGFLGRNSGQQAPHE
jgi:hypothetical protein